MKEKIKKQKAFIQIPILIAIVIVSVSIAAMGVGVVLYKQQRTPAFTANVGEILYKTIYEKKFEVERLQQEAELSKIREERAEEHAQEEMSKRIEAEQIAKEETIKRAQEEIARQEAEQKAQKEKTTRIIKEQELATKEAEEREMNADNDGDGLTYRQELSKGTSDWNTDSDNDGIIDSKDTHPAGGGRNMPQTFTWSYGGYDWNWTESIQQDWYDYYKAKPRGSAESLEYITSDDPFIKKISEVISKGEEKGANKVGLAISFVQNLPYVDDIFTGYDEYPKYPVETFFEKNGDCEDTSYLAASIIDAMNIGSVLILLPGHMAVGVWMNCDTPGTYYELDGRCYYYVETTSKDWAAGEVPDRYRDTRATLIKVSSGGTKELYPQYKKPCELSSDFPGYYFDGQDYYSDSRCYNSASCLPYREYYFDGNKFFHDSDCSQVAVPGCYKSKSFPGKFYKSSYAWYYDSSCTQFYQSMDCNYPNAYSYTCLEEPNYTSKEDWCGQLRAMAARSGLLGSPMDQSVACQEELAQCRKDIDEYKRKKNEYYRCLDIRE